jgi:pyrimidine operon attenuation protein/uracil phosphoribosyltransferase
VGVRRWTGWFTAFRYRSAARSAILGAMAAPPRQSTVLDARAFDRTVRRMADEIVELNNGTDDLVIVGIQRRGVQLAAQIVSTIAEREKADVPQGALDITLYRDDLQTVGPRPLVGQTRIPVDIDGKHVVIVDDVLYTGRTIRAALDELADFGRPKRIALAVLIDRGGRELPIQPDIVGKTVQPDSSQRVDVLVEELDGRNAVIIADREAST